MGFWSGVLYGTLGSIVITPLIILLISYIRTTKMKLKIIKDIKSGNVLEPLDEKDYNSNEWDDIIDVNKNKDLLNKFKQKYDKPDITSTIIEQ